MPFVDGGGNYIIRDGYRQILMFLLTGKNQKINYISLHMLSTRPNNAKHIIVHFLCSKYGQNSAYSSCREETDWKQVSVRSSVQHGAKGTQKHISYLYHFQISAFVRFTCIVSFTIVTRSCGPVDPVHYLKEVYM